MFERFTHAAREVVVGAQQQARRLGHEEIRAEHLLLALVAGEDAATAALRRCGLDAQALEQAVARTAGAAAAALAALGIDLADVRRRAEDAFGPGALERPRLRRKGFLRRHVVSTGGHIPFTDPAKAALENALREALALRHRGIGTEHLLLGMLASERTPVAHLLRGLGVDPAAVRAAVLASVSKAA
ncbi:Clp protease N-terminal domain-containing protein [Kineococcus glutinatus]|uniref:Clp R domain-containing protein n=1 Tax=Kineococcus glutinatus TaxID=1070872 RepID=A0ABP9HRM1_9ACTN